jgi:3'-phosphoadenosine 5'-phosphosulfate sulfotransferase (PAPS reductase)/FAD synthetase
MSEKKVGELTMKITSHKQLSELIEGKRILIGNSLGKDSVLCLAWLCEYAKPSHIVSVYFDFLASHPEDELYLNYLKKRYPKVEFVNEPNSVELSLISEGCYQTPIEAMENNSWDYVEFYREKQISDLKEKHKIDYLCTGSSKYESFARRVKFYQKGLLFKKEIFPLGLMTKDQVIGLIKNIGIKLHPCYKYTPSTFDHPSYFKMRNGLIASSQYERRVMQIYPLLALDKYRYEKLL